MLLGSFDVFSLPMQKRKETSKTGVRQEVRTVLERSDNDMIHTVSISDNFTEAVEIAKMAI